MTASLPVTLAVGLQTRAFRPPWLQVAAGLAGMAAMAAVASLLRADATSSGEIAPGIARR